MFVFTARQRSDEGNVFSGVCLSVCLSTGRSHVVITHEPVRTCSLGETSHPLCPHKDLTIQRPVQTCLQVGGWHSTEIAPVYFCSGELDAGLKLLTHGQSCFEFHYHFVKQLPGYTRIQEEDKWAVFVSKLTPGLYPTDKNLFMFCTPNADCRPYICNMYKLIHKTWKHTPWFAQHKNDKTANIDKK